MAGIVWLLATLVSIMICLDFIHKRYGRFLAFVFVIYVTSIVVVLALREPNCFQ